MTVLTTLISFKTIKLLNPIFLSISILTISLLSAMSMFKSIHSSWMSFVLILTFSSGMMTLFMYTASMTANEYNKNKKTSFTIFYTALICLVIPSYSNTMKMESSMKSFSNSMIIMIMAIILIITMLALAIHGHHPDQTISSSF